MEQMGRTLRVAGRVAGRHQAVVPAEYGRAAVVVNLPGAQAQKMLKLLMAHAGPRMGVDEWHVMDGRTLREYAGSGLQHLSRSNLDKVFRELHSMFVEWWQYRADMDQASARRSGVLKDSIVDVRESEGGERSTFIRWRFSDAWQEMVERSDHYAVLQNVEYLSLRSQYAVRMHTYLLTCECAERRTEVRLTLDGLRAALGVDDGKYSRFREFNKYVLGRAVRELREVLGWTVGVTLVRRGRWVAEVVLEWDRSAAPAEVDAAVVVVGKFPENGRLAGTGWAAIVRVLAPSWDVDVLGQKYVAWLAKKKKVSLSDAGNRGRFESFCRTLEASGEATRKEPEVVEPEVVVDEVGAEDSGRKFPNTLMVGVYRYWRNLAEKHAGSMDVDHVGQEFQRYCEHCGIALDAADISDRFVMFCKRRVWRESWNKKTETAARALTWSRRAES